VLPDAQQRFASARVSVFAVRYVRPDTLESVKTALVNYHHDCR
jgi:hypothetical protein